MGECDAHQTSRERAVAARLLDEREDKLVHELIAARYKLQCLHRSLPSLPCVPVRRELTLLGCSSTAPFVVVSLLRPPTQGALVISDHPPWHRASQQCRRGPCQRARISRVQAQGAREDGEGRLFQARAPAPARARAALEHSSRRLGQRCRTSSTRTARWSSTLSVSVPLPSSSLSRTAC